VTQDGEVTVRQPCFYRMDSRNAKGGVARMSFQDHGCRIREAGPRHFSEAAAQLAGILTWEGVEVQ